MSYAKTKPATGLPEILGDPSPRLRDAAKRQFKATLLLVATVLMANLAALVTVAVSVRV